MKRYGLGCRQYEAGSLSVASYSGWQIMALYDSPQFSAGILCVSGNFVLSGSDILVRSKFGPKKFGAKNLKTSIIGVIAKSTKFFTSPAFP